MYRLGKMALRHPARRLAAMIVLLCSLSFLAAGRAPVSEAAAMYLVTDTGYLTLSGEAVLSSAAAEEGTIIGTGEDIRLSDGQGVDVIQGSATLSVTAQDETVTSLLDRLGIVSGPMDMISVDLTGERALITIASEMIFYEKETSVLTHQVTYISDPFLAEGTEVVETQGHDGQKTEVYEVICHEGQVTSRSLVDILEEPALDTVIRVGAGQDAAVAAVNTNSDGSGVLVLSDGTEIPFSEARTMRATAYTTGDPGVGTITATGTTVRVGTVAVDPKAIPYGTRMFIVSNDGRYIYGFGVAEDTGGAIRSDRIDLYYGSHNECIQFGRRDCTVYLLED